MFGVTRVDANLRSGVYKVVCLPRKLGDCKNEGLALGCFGGFFEEKQEDTLFHRMSCQPEMSTII